MNLKSIRDGFQGKRFSALVRHHIQRQSPHQLVAGLTGTLGLLSEREKPAAERTIDIINGLAYDPNFWQKDCAEVFDVIISAAKEELHKIKVEPTDKTLFNIFQVIALNFALMAHEQENFRKFAGI